MKIYREVKTEDRLPTEKGIYFVKCKQPETDTESPNDIFYWWNDSENRVEKELESEYWENTFDVWLEPFTAAAWRREVTSIWKKSNGQS
jgi:hypothetical protein